MKYKAYVCYNCGRAQGTSSRIKGVCVVCRKSNYFNNPKTKNKVKILAESNILSEITNIIKKYNANKENVKYY